MIITTKTVALGMACLLVTSTAARAQNADITGPWELTVTMAEGTTRSAGLVLKDQGGKIVGTLSRTQGDLAVEATVKQKAVTIAFTVPTDGGPLPVLLTGAADSDAGRARTLSGTVDLGSEGKGQWTAARPAAASAGSVDVTGVWAFAVEFSGGSGAPTMTFKQDGETLTGRYVGQLGEAPLTGTLKGSAIEFTIALTIEGNAVGIRYAGTVERGAMKGTVTFGDMGEGTFTAAQKP